MRDRARTRLVVLVALGAVAFATAGSLIGTGCTRILPTKREYIDKQNRIVPHEQAGSRNSNAVRKPAAD